MKVGWIVVNQQTTESIVVLSSYSTVGEINHLANPPNQVVTKASDSLCDDTRKPSRSWPSETVPRSCDTPMQDHAYRLASSNSIQS